MSDHRLSGAGSTNRLIADGHVRGGGSPFALPVGLKGRLAGWYMGRPDAQHRELARVAPLERRTRVVEIGFGPGQLLEMFHLRAPGLDLAGVDPSELMVGRARRRCPSAHLHLGAAATTPFPANHADFIISVNNIPMWPDLDAGLVEVRRLLQPGGVAWFAWHGGHDPRGHQRRLVLGAEQRATIEATIGRHFAEVCPITLQHSDVWEASGAGR